MIMSLSNAQAYHPQSGSKAAGEIDSSAFSLRDTLKGITVREANFAEFLAALKNFGAQTAKQ